MRVVDVFQGTSYLDKGYVRKRGFHAVTFYIASALILFFERVLVAGSVVAHLFHISLLLRACLQARNVTLTSSLP